MVEIWDEKICIDSPYVRDATRFQNQFDFKTDFKD